MLCWWGVLARMASPSARGLLQRTWRSSATSLPLLPLQQLTRRVPPLFSLRLIMRYDCPLAHIRMLAGLGCYMAWLACTEESFQPRSMLHAVSPRDAAMLEVCKAAMELKKRASQYSAGIGINLGVGVEGSCSFVTQQALLLAQRWSSPAMHGATGCWRLYAGSAPEQRCVARAGPPSRDPMTHSSASWCLLRERASLSVRLLTCHGFALQQPSLPVMQM